MISWNAAQFDHGALQILGFAPRNVVEVVVLERAIEIIGVAKPRVRVAVTLPVAVAQRVVGEVVEDIKWAALPGLDATVVVAVEHGLPDLVVVDEQARERHVTPYAAGLGAVDIYALRVTALDDVACQFQRARACDFHARPRAVARRPPARLQRVVAIDAHIAQAPA